MDENDHQIFDKAKGPNRHAVDDLDKIPLLKENGEEIPVFDYEGNRIARREPVENTVDGPCGVLMNLQNVKALFSPGATTSPDDYDEVSDDDSDLLQQRPMKVEVFPLGFLRTVGNLQATGPPQCLHPTLRRINNSIYKSPLANQPSSDSEDDSSLEERQPTKVQAAPAVTAIASQFYNLFAHRAAPRAGRLDSQQGLATAALAGGFAQNTKDKNRAIIKRMECDTNLPSERFHKRINIPNCPKSCRTEVVYTVDVRNLKSKSGRYETHSPSEPTHNANSFIFNNIILPLARSWEEPEMRDGIKNHLFIFKPKV